MKRPDLAAKVEWSRVRDRVRDHAAVKQEVEKWTLQHPVAQLVDRLLTVGVPAAPIYDIAQVVADPHIAGAREMFVDIEHPVAGKIKITGSHIKLSETPPTIRKPSPALGENNAEIFGDWLGISSEELEQLKAAKVI